MAMPDLAKRWTRDEVLALPDDGNRYELIDGELLVTPSPTGRHQRAVLKLYDQVAPYVLRHRIGQTSLAPADLDLRSGQVSQPDLFVGALIAGREPIEWPEFGVPILIAEILSPSTARSDRLTKRRRYQASGALTYWIVDVDARLVETWHPDSAYPTITDQTLEWQPDPGIPALVIELPASFRAVWGE